MDNDVLHLEQSKKNWSPPQLYPLSDIDIHMNSGDGIDGGGGSDNAS